MGALPLLSTAVRGCGGGRNGCHASPSIVFARARARTPRPLAIKRRARTTVYGHTLPSLSFLPSSFPPPPGPRTPGGGGTWDAATVGGVPNAVAPHRRAIVRTAPDVAAAAAAAIDAAAAAAAVDAAATAAAAVPSATEPLTLAARRRRYHRRLLALRAIHGAPYVFWRPAADGRRRRRCRVDRRRSSGRLGAADGVCLLGGHLVRRRRPHRFLLLGPN